MVLLMLSSCSEGNEKVIAKNEEANKEFLSAAVSAMNDRPLALSNKLEWGDTYADVKKAVDEPYINNDGQYLSSAFYGALPTDDTWKDADGNINAKAFAPIDLLSYFVVDDAIGLYECGYLAPDANLYQYDFLKLYYTKKFGEPDKETWEWKDKYYEPTGDEDYYSLFADGYVKVLTVWDLKELDTVLVIDWLNDPNVYNNNYGQISFYQRSEDFSVEDAGDSDE